MYNVIAKKTYEKEDGELIPIYHIEIDGTSYLASEQEYNECEDWNDNDIKSFLKQQLI